jgi:hypothetical protein
LEVAALTFAMGSMYDGLYMWELQGHIRHALFACLIIHTFQFIFSVGIVFFSHNKSANSTLSHGFSAKRTGPMSNHPVPAFQSLTWKGGKYISWLVIYVPWFDIKRRIIYLLISLLFLSIKVMTGFTKSSVVCDKLGKELSLVYYPVRDPNSRPVLLQVRIGASKHGI